MKTKLGPPTIFAVLIAAAVIGPALLSRGTDDNALFILSRWLIQFVSTCFLIARIGRSKSAFQSMCMMVALACLVWNSVDLFRSYDCSNFSPISWSISSSDREIDTRFYHLYHHWEIVCRLSWWLLTVVYATLFVEAVMSRTRRRTERCPAEAPRASLFWPRRSSARRMCLLLFGEVSLLVALWQLAYGWLTVLGIVASFYLVAVVWRRQVSVWMTRRLVVRVRRLVPEILAVFCGLWLSVLWSYFGWSSAVAILAFLIAAGTVLGLSPTAVQQARRRPVALVLILVLVFEVSARLLVPVPVSMHRYSIQKGQAPPLTGRGQTALISRRHRSAQDDRAGGTRHAELGHKLASIMSQTICVMGKPRGG
jgi:hypothetical protein